MKVKITLTSSDEISLPTGFSRHLQAIIYNFLDRVSAQWLHEKGFKFENRSFKLFTFSSFFEKPKFLKDKKIFIFPKEVSFLISSPIKWVIEQVVYNITIAEKIKLGDNVTMVSAIEIIEDDDIIQNKIRIKTITPIEVHSTILDENGSKKTYYYSPVEIKFFDLINKNLQKKWVAYHQEDCPHNLKISPVRSDLCRKNIRTFKGIIIEGWTGHFWIEGNPEFLKLGLSAGLGSRNSQGFGMVDIVKSR